MWGWFGANADKPTKKAPVTLHVYDLGPAVAGVNVLLGAVGTGAFHAGVEVYGTEWSFGCCCEGPYGSGIFCVPPKGCDAHVYRESVAMGETLLTKRQVDDLIDKLARAWPGSSYDLLRHNCCHFSDEFCQKLGVDRVPAWVLSLAGVGAMLRSAVRLGAGAVGGAAHAVVQGAGGAYAAVYEGVGYGVERRPNERPSQAPAATQEAAEEERPSPFACQMPAAGNRQNDLPNGPGGRGLGAGLRAGIAGNLFGFRASGAIPEEEGQKRAVASEDRADGPPLVAGDAVEVFSNSHGAWCLGRIESVDATGMATVSFRLPGAALNELATKLLPLTHKHLRRAKPEARAAEEGGPLATGDLVEIYSNSKQAWCPGYVETINGRTLKVAFQLPGYPDGELARKELPVDHKDIRRRKGDGTEAAADGPRRGGKLEPPAADAANRGASPGTARSGRGKPGAEGAPEDTSASADAPAADGPTYRVGDWVEVFTNTHQVWCLGRVTQADPSGKVHVVFQMPGAGTDEWVVKRLQPGCKEMRAATVTAADAAEPVGAPVWTAEEESFSSQRFEELLATAAKDGQASGTLVTDNALADYLRGSGLPRRALKEIWQVSNPAGKALLGLSEFRVCCRLVAHCQTRSWDRADMLSEGGDALRRLLEGELLKDAAPKLAEFKGPSGH